MTDDERDQSVRMLAHVCFEMQTWTAALKEILISKGLTTDEEFARYVAAAKHSRDRQETELSSLDRLADFEGPEQ